MIAYLDIETAPAPQTLWDGLRAALDAVPGNYSRPESIEQWALENAGSVWARGALTPQRGRVVVAAVCFDDSPEERAYYGDDEAQVLHGLDLILGQRTPRQIVAHNGGAFDFPFLRWRALALGIPSLARKLWQAKPWDDYLVDTAGPDWSPRPARPSRGWEYNLDALADMLGIERLDNPIPGSEVPLAWHDGRADEVVRHCLDDVRTLRAVHMALAQGRAA